MFIFVDGGSGDGWVQKLVIFCRRHELTTPLLLIEHEWNWQITNGNPPAENINNTLEMCSIGILSTKIDGSEDLLRNILFML